MTQLPDIQDQHLGNRVLLRSFSCCTIGLHAVTVDRMYLKAPRAYNALVLRYPQIKIKYPTPLPDSI